MRYFGVIGNRDFIKIDGEKRPFYEFLNVQPDGWLTSLVYAKNFPRPPEKQMIIDCGAWSYRNNDHPSVTPESVIEQYLDYGKPGDIVVAPDHMLLPDSNVKARQKFNRKSAKKFLDICPSEFLPMAIVHGITVADRVKEAKKLRAMGYRFIGIGGIAAQASRRNYCIEAVEAVRNALPDAHIHIMGLSSPNYFNEWARIGVSSCDGSSHFKQAFTGGAFFSLDWTGKLIKHQAARRDNESQLPDISCDCGVCRTMKGQGIDTRSYGSNENNMGRAVHNMNMLMLAQAAKVSGIRFLVSCVSKKGNRGKAKDLYQSAWFTKARTIAEEYGSDWGILSAKHGYIDPDDVISPYDETLGSGNKEWAKSVANQIISTHSGSPVFMLAGKRYRENLAPLLNEAGISTYAPLCGMGIGQQLQAMSFQAQGELL